MNKEGQYSNGTKIIRFKCPVCQVIFDKPHYVSKDFSIFKCCSRECTNKSKVMNIDKKSNIILEYTSFPGTISMVRGPKRFVELASMCTNIPIPIFDGIIELISEDLDWMKALYMVYSNQIKLKMNCGENLEIIERMEDLIDFMENAHLSFMNDFVYTPKYYFNDFRSNTNPGIRNFNGEFVNEYSRNQEELKAGISPFDCDFGSEYQPITDSVGLTPFNY